MELGIKHIKHHGLLILNWGFVSFPLQISWYGLQKYRSWDLELVLPGLEWIIIIIIIIMGLTETSEVTLSNVIYSGNFLFLFNTSLGVLFNAHKSLKLLAFIHLVTQIHRAFLFLCTRNKRMQLLVSMFLFQE